MRPNLLRLSALTSAVVLGLSLAACSDSGEGSSTPPAADQSPVTSDSVTPTPEGGGNLQGEGDDYVFGVDRDQLAQVIEQTFKNKNAVVAWEGDTLVLSMDGDAAQDMAGYTECHVVLDFVKENETVAIEFPNGRVDCADVVE